MSGTSLDFIQIITNLDDITGPGKAIWLAIDAFCYVMALWFGLLAMQQLARHATDGGRTPLKAAGFTLLAAVLLGAIPSTITTVAAAIYGDLAVSPLSSVKADGANRAAHAVLQVVSLVGYAFFVRSIFVLRNAGQPERGHDTTGKALMIMGAGMAAIYIDTTLRLVGGVTGWNVDKYFG